MRELRDTFDIIFVISKVSFSFVRLKPKSQKISLLKFPAEDVISLQGSSTWRLTFSMQEDKVVRELIHTTSGNSGAR
jgi:hypothetical protein